MESPGAYVDDCILRGHFCGVPVSFGPLSRALGTYLHLERGGMPFHDGVGINCKKGATTEIKAQEPSMWAKGCMVGDSACVIGLDMATPP